MNNVVISCNNVSRSFYQGDIEVPVLNDVNISLNAGEQVAIMGSSGSGKTTLLQILAGLDKPCSGEIKILDNDVHQLNEKKKSALRNKSMGFIYQLHHLLPEFTALENVCMPLFIAGMNKEKAIETATQILSEVGLGQRLTHKPSALSGGERQRTAVARALVNNPAIVLADEPTGNLDPKTASHVYDVMCELNQQRQTCFIIVTHDEKLASKMDRRFVIEEGCLNEV